MPVFYECQRCTSCCRWPGQVRLADDEVTRLAKFLGLSEHDFIQKFTRITRARLGLALQERLDGACIFLDGADCRIQSVKPEQCRGFPNLWNFPGFEKVCQAIPRVLDETTYRERLALSTGTGPAGSKGSLQGDFQP